MDLALHKQKCLIEFQYALKPTLSSIQNNVRGLPTGATRLDAEFSSAEVARPYKGGAYLEVSAT